MTEEKKEIEYQFPGMICGNCIFWEEGHHQKEQTPLGRGACYGGPPTPYPMPQQSKVALGGGKVNIVPVMYRPILDKHERFCGSYTPDEEAASYLIKLKEEAERGCNCGEGDGCDGCPPGT